MTLDTMKKKQKFSIINQNHCKYRDDLETVWEHLSEKNNFKNVIYNALCFEY